MDCRPILGREDGQGQDERHHYQRLRCYTDNTICSTASGVDIVVIHSFQFDQQQRFSNFKINCTSSLGTSRTPTSPTARLPIQNMSYYASHSPHTRSPGSSSPTSSSGAATPPSSSFLSSSVSGLWGGLVRRFSAETTAIQPTPSRSTSLPHANTFAGADGVYVPPHRTASPMRPPPLEPLVLKGVRDDTPARARLLTPAIAEEIRMLVPARLGIVDEWNLVYSLDQDGASLATLYEKCGLYEGRRVGYVLVVRDCDGGVCLSPLCPLFSLFSSMYGSSIEANKREGT